MHRQRLSWHIGLPFAAYVLAGSIALLGWMMWSIAKEDRAHFEELAVTNAAFMDRAGIPASESMATQLSEVLGVGVVFRKGDVFTPELNKDLSAETLSTLKSFASNGRCQQLAGYEVVAVPLNQGDVLMLARKAFPLIDALKRPRTFVALGGFWFLAFVVAWMVSREMVRPLRNLAARLPEIEKPGALELPEALRQDEIGDVARAFVRTREALQNERSQRVRAEKLAVLGRMTAALAHEIQNPVAAIKMHAQLISPEKLADSVKTISGEADRIESLVSQWMFLSRPEPPVMNRVNVVELLQNVVDVSRDQACHARVKVEMTFAADSYVKGDSKRLRQVFGNLMTNAIQAMPGGGRLGIDVSRKEQNVEIIFADEGKGFSTQALERFSEFFFTEKEGGMGIGLSVASEIVKAHGGALNVRNQAQGGARVTVILPASES